MKIKIGECGVDSGLLMVGDPCYFVGMDATINERCSTWQQACDDLFCKEENMGQNTPIDVFGLGVAINTTHGDGVYSVYLEIKNGKRRIIIDLE